MGFKEYLAETYGDKRDHKKIDIYVDGKYKASTTWAKTTKEAVAKYKEKNPKAESVVATFAKKK